MMVFFHPGNQKIVIVKENSGEPIFDVIASNPHKYGSLIGSARASTF